MKTFPRQFLVFAATTALSLGALAEEAAPAPNKAEKLILPKLVLKKARVHEAVRFLTATSKKLDPAKTGVTVTFTGPAGDETRVDLDADKMSILDAAKQVAESANLDLTVKGDTITLAPKPGAKPPPIQR